MTKPLLSLIWAMDENRLIGNNNALPWHLPADLAFFKRTTMSKPIIMGRKTFDSIGRPLPGRQNIIITRNSAFTAEGCDIARNIEEAMSLVSEDAPEAMLIGGASLYLQTLEQADFLYLTQIHHAFSGDTWFPEMDMTQWSEDFREDFEADEKNIHAHSFMKFSRKK
jgi:dihydrofolate reductase|tara:strand:+ start:602 stop:1102 length:501 start_codon:yes stop_codon:yes gene_type:complete